MKSDIYTIYQAVLAAKQYMVQANHKFFKMSSSYMIYYRAYMIFYRAYMISIPVLYLLHNNKQISIESKTAGC